MRFIKLAGALALTALTLGAAPSFAQERYARHDDERDRVSSRRPTISLSLAFGNTRPQYSSRYRSPSYDSRSSYDSRYSNGRSFNRSCARGGRGGSTTYGYGRDDRSYGSRYSDRDREDDYGRSNREYRGY
jgi:hypothetical protein